MNHVISVLAGTILLTTGCATVYDGKYPLREGWRTARVTDVASASSLARLATIDCREKTRWSDSDVFARVEYRYSRVKRGYIVKLPQDMSLKTGDVVYVNVRDCSMPPIPPNAALQR